MLDGQSIVGRAGKPCDWDQEPLRSELIKQLLETNYTVCMEEGTFTQADHLRMAPMVDQASGKWLALLVLAPTSFAPSALSILVERWHKHAKVECIQVPRGPLHEELTSLVATRSDLFVVRDRAMGKVMAAPVDLVPPLCTLIDEFAPAIESSWLLDHISHPAASRPKARL